MSYGIAKRISKHGHNFGKGEIEGVVAPETAAHAAGTAALLPMLSLGVPGSPTAAVLLGGLLIWGLQPGPLLFVEQKEFVWGLIASMYLGNIVGLIIVLTCVPLFAAILRIPFSIIAPIILVLCAIGAYTVHNIDLRRRDDAGVRRRRLRAEEVQLPAGAAGAGDRARRQGGGIVPAVAARLAGQPRRSSSRTAWSARIMALGLIALFWPLISRWLEPAAAAAGGLTQDRDAIVRRSDRMIVAAIVDAVEYCIPVMS